MFGIFKKNKAAPVRVLSSVSDLRNGDMISLKERSVLPAILQGKTLTIEKVQTYQYSDGYSPEFVLRLPTGETVTLTVSDEEDGEYITFAIELSRSVVLKIFNEDQFSEVFGASFAVLKTDINECPDHLSDWVTTGYRQSVKEGVAFFYGSDKRGESPSSYADDGAEELRYYECEGDDDSFAVNIEVWEDGSTEVYAEVSVPLNVVEDMWPSSSS